MLGLSERHSLSVLKESETKWNIACYDRLVWVDKVAVIVTGKD